MTDTLCIALTQINPTVGDVVGNVACLRRARADAAAFVTGQVIRVDGGHQAWSA